MSLFPTLNGFYDDEGNWQRTKFCVISCGDQCDCMPPNMKLYEESKDKRREYLWNCPHCNYENLEEDSNCHQCCKPKDFTEVIQKGRSANE